MSTFLSGYKVETGGEKMLSSTSNLAVVKASPFVFPIDDDDNYVGTWTQGVGGLKKVYQIIFNPEENKFGNVTQVNTTFTSITQPPRGKMIDGGYAISWGTASANFTLDGTPLGRGSPFSVPDPTTATSNDITANIESSSLRLSNGLGNIGNSVVIGTDPSHVYNSFSVFALPNYNNLAVFGVFGVDTTTGNVISSVFSSNLNGGEPERLSFKTIDNKNHTHSGVSVARVGSNGTFLSLSTGFNQYNITSEKFSMLPIEGSKQLGGGGGNDVAIIGGAAGGGALLFAAMGIYFGRNTQLGKFVKSLLCGEKKSGIEEGIQR